MDVGESTLNYLYFTRNVIHVSISHGDVRWGVLDVCECVCGGSCVHVCICLCECVYVNVCVRCGVSVYVCVWCE